MAFGGFKNVGEVALRYQVTLGAQEFIQPLPTPIDEAFRKRLTFDRLNAPVTVSEQATSEFLIAPILHEMWLAYSYALMICSHVQFGADSPLSGFPDYFFSKRSPLGRVLEQPYVLFVEAKCDDFEAAWAQALAAMLAAQRMNSQSAQPIFGS